MKAVIVAAGAHAPSDRRVLEGADVVIAADGGADWLATVGRTPDRVVGDLDSTDLTRLEQWSDAGIRVDRQPTDKDASDLELSLVTALALGADELVILGGLGGDLDHLAANLLLLGSDLAAGHRLSLVHDRTTARVLVGPAHIELSGTVGSRVSLFGLGVAADGVTTEGLRWSLGDARLEPGSSRGLANVIDNSPASVWLTAGQLLVIEIASPQGDSGE